MELVAVVTIVSGQRCNWPTITRIRKVVFHRVLFGSCWYVL